MMRLSGSAALLVALLAACLAGACTARELLGPAPYVQCGGSGSGCTGAKCKDAVWPGFKCASGFKCFRVSQYYWQCDKKQPPMTTASPTRAPYTKADFKQCGGLGNNCMGSKCRDGVWPGAMCKAGLKCMRVSSCYWQCDTRKLPAEPDLCKPRKPSTPTKKPMTYTKADFHQCGGKGNNCKGAKCQDAQWPANQGGMCAAGLKCYRVSQYYRGCDTHQPTTSG